LTDLLTPSMSERMAENDDQARQVCDHCGFVNYQNPKIIVGSVVYDDDRILLCRRAIYPRRGFWTIPAGYLENNETPEEGAKREALEEANARLNLGSLLAIYTMKHLSQVQLIYSATLRDLNISAGKESLDVQFFKWKDIPWDELAFPTVLWALSHAKLSLQNKHPVPFGNPFPEPNDNVANTLHADWVQ
jgi:ADP-ribose pyrophosphatase YjhB (NUDIX family)